MGVPMETDVVEKKHPDNKKATTNGIKDSKEEAGDIVPKDPDLLTLEDIREQVRYIEKAVSTKEHHYLTRVVRSVVRIRRKLNSNVLLRLIHGYLPRPSSLKDSYLKYLPEVIWCLCRCFFGTLREHITYCKARFIIVHAVVRV